MLAYFHLLLVLAYFLIEHMCLQLQVVLVGFIFLLEDFATHHVILVFVADVHVSAAHWQAEVGLLLLVLLDSSTSSQLLQLPQSLFVLFIFLLNLVADKTHVLASPDHGELVGC